MTAGVSQGPAFRREDSNDYTNCNAIGLGRSVVSHPALIVNPRSGGGRATAIGLVPAAQQLGLETVTMQPGDDLAAIAGRLVDGGYDHLLMAGGDGSLAIVAQVAVDRRVAFSCVPVGTRNHFAMDLGLDRRHPLESLDAAVDGVERWIDVGLVAGQAFLNNVSFGLYATAIADPEYRNHRARSITDAAVDTARRADTRITLTLPDGRVITDAEVLLASNNPYRFIGPPDFATRPALDTGTLGIIAADRRSRQQRGPAAFTRSEAATFTVDTDHGEIRAGVDGELRTFQTPVEVAIAPKALRVLVPPQTQPKTLRESIEHLNDRAIAHVSGLPPLPRPKEPDPKAPLLRRFHEIDDEVFEQIAAWESPLLDHLMPSLSQAASHSKIWIAMALAMSLAGGSKGRRTAIEGLTAVAATSFLANVVVKGLLRRPRPTDPVPEARRLPVPGSTSMPSGHTASAAAFTRVVGAAYPGLLIPLNALSASIGFSRVYTGVHYPSDVAAGWLLGRGVASLVIGLTAAARNAQNVAARIRGAR
jgi:diacylglycerol kinase family enzyme/membrane-associated phospholipid phosphatase